jgi:hypothetical protein
LQRVTSGTQRVSFHSSRPFAVATVVLALTLAAGTATSPADRGRSPVARLAAAAATPVTRSQPSGSAAQIPTSHVTYRGRWVRVAHPGYAGGQALASRQRGASATLTFTGTRVSWIGPTGPTRGRARVYVDGRYVRTVDTYSVRFNPSRVLYSATYAVAKERRLSIVVAGTPGRSMVTIDSLVVRGTASGGGPSDPPTPTPTPTPTPPGMPPGMPTPTATSTPPGTPTSTPTSTPPGTPTSTPTPTPQSNATVRVSSVSALLAALRDGSVREIVVADGTYSTDWLDINASTYPGYARTSANPVLVRAETDGGVTFDLGGQSSPHIIFRNGAAYQEWRGFRFGNSTPSNNGVIHFGDGSGPASHHLTLRNIEFLPSIVVGAGPNGNYTNGQGIYFSWAPSSTGGNHDILIDGFACNARLWSCIHAYHDDQGVVGHDITIRNVTIGTDNTMGIVLWSGTIHDWLIEDVTIAGVTEYGVRHAVGGTGITLRRVTTTGSGKSGFYSSLGTFPNVPGLTFVDSTFN